jgi:hypothetical protein
VGPVARNITGIVAGSLTARLNGRDNANMKSITNERGVDRIVFSL